MANHIYSPLSTASNQIRLLNLLPASQPSDPLKCDLFIESLDSLPSYEALSYTWGTAEGHTIIVRGETINITANLDSALRDLRDTTSTRTLWIDALSINQANILERNQQVSRMRNIYQTATKVIIWLGSETPESRKALRFVGEFHFRLGLAKSAKDVEKLIQDTFKLPRYQKVWAALAEVVTRSWFTRAWTLQEILVAADAVVYCGTQFVFWRLFADISFLVDHYESMFQIDEPFYPDTSRFVLKYNHLYNKALFQKQSMSGHPPLLLESLTILRPFLCTDPRDKVFAVIGISKDNLVGNPVRSEGPHIQVDYSKSIVEVYKDVTRHLINKMGNLDVLSACQFRQQQKGLPSWAPDWSIARTNGPIRNRDQWGDIHYASDLEASMASYQQRTWQVGDAEGSDGLRIQGTLVGRIAEVGNPHSYNGLWDDLRPNWFNLALQCSSSFPDGRPILLGDEIPNDGSALYFTGQPISKAFLQTCVFHRVTGEEDGEEWKLKWHIAKIEAIEQRRFLVTANGFMGIGPMEAEVGDAVVVLAGARVPFVLRELNSERGDWQVVGEAYCHGIMKGEIGNETNGSEIEQREFTLF